MRDKHPNKQLKIELLSRWKLEAESRNIQRSKCEPLGRGARDLVKTEKKRLPCVRSFLSVLCFSQKKFSTHIEKND